MTFYPSYIGACMLLSYKWDGWDRVGILCGAIIRASLCDANNQRNGDVTYRLSFATWTGLAVAVFPLLENWACKNWKIIG